MQINYTPFFHGKVVGTLYKLPEKTTGLFWKTVEKLEENPHHPDATQRAGYTNVYELPVNGYIMVFEIQEDTHSFRVLDFTLP